MSKQLFPAMLCAVALSIGAASGTDAQSYSAPVRDNSYFWQGPYVGANLGYQWGSVSGLSADPSGVMGGIQGGRNWQIGKFVFGAETDLQLSDASDQFAQWKFSNPWFGTARARAGYAMNNVLFYGTIGLAYGTLKSINTITAVTESKTSIGWAGGLGAEVGFSGNWTAKAEYLYVDLGDRNHVLQGARLGIDSNLLRLGVNYRF